VTGMISRCSMSKVLEFYLAQAVNFTLNNAHIEPNRNKDGNIRVCLLVES
jgi:hypothetical protein